MHPNLRTKKKSFCWIGILAETLFILNSTLSWADTVQKPSNPLVNHNQPHAAGGNLSQRNPADVGGPGLEHSRNSPSPYFDDEDDDGEDDDFFARMPSRPSGGRQTLPDPNRPGGFTGGLSGNLPSQGLRNGPGGRSAGGLSRSEGPDPVRTSGGISVGGQSPNGVISNTSIPALKIDDESAEGSKEMVTDFNFPDADILDLAKTLGKLTGKNFILDKDVKGKVSIITNSPISVSQAWKLFLTALDVNGFALVPSGAYLRIAKQRDARDKQLKTYTGDSSPDTDALITRVFSLKFISAEEVSRTFRNLMPATSRIIPYEQTNTVIVTDTGSNITRLAKLLEILDVEGFDAGIEVIPVKYASAAELSKLIDTLIPGTAAGAGPPGGPPGMPRVGGRFNARRTKEGGIINTIIADERTNTLIVHANVKGTDQVRELVAKLDLKVPTSQGGGKVRVVYLQFADAEQVANTLNNFSSQSKSPGFSPPGGGGTGSNPIAGSLFEGSIKISPDKATNSLVITASPSDFVTVQRVINQLDIPREQVYVEVVLMEVAMVRGMDLSANMAAPNWLIGSTPGGAADLSFLMSGPLGVLSNAGALVTLPFPGLGKSTITTPQGVQIPDMPNAFAILKAAQNNQNISILATPQIIALDNTEATFVSDEKIPLQTTTQVQGAGSNVGFGTTQTISTSIKIKPQINKMINFVKMDVEVKLGDIDNSNVPQNVKANANGTTERKSQTTVLVGDSDTVVLGGLIRDKSSDQTVKVPLLGDIPILGWLFKSKTTKVEKRNLLIFMTPHIVRQYAKIRTILDKKLKERDEFLELNSGGTDPLRYQRDEMIRSLPNIKDLEDKHPPLTINIDDDRSPTPSSSPTPAAKEISPQKELVIPPSVAAPVPAPTPANGAGSTQDPAQMAIPGSAPESTLAPQKLPESFSAPDSPGAASTAPTPPTFPEEPVGGKSE
jgi:general secretion pathway protein D